MDTVFSNSEFGGSWTLLPKRTRKAAPTTALASPELQRAFRPFSRSARAGVTMLHAQIPSSTEVGPFPGKGKAGEEEEARKTRTAQGGSEKGLGNGNDNNVTAMGSQEDLLDSRAVRKGDMTGSRDVSLSLFRFGKALQRRNKCTTACLLHLPIFAHQI
ncbi:hypothetical protein PHSY_001205 [Pseudozyma hubeiensis SY62]|uniref:Uncharacterized protein n=1 Tax=Pseudozyma hubeiensis (strain SY62) TaxID=1305764 RepID=R9P6A1_PSEHS|nr:hypothetical protein PHSY_001205 [Pseudozyma hubeiensis SY62]GAC93640.1 hypothetical protein PHSY_001205 [Pseudozyma hubeiensis SY62]